MIRKTLTIFKRYWWAVIILGVTAWLVYVGVNCHLWPKSNCTGFQGKTIWDVLELLIIPATLAGVAAILDRFERKTDREIAENRAILDREIANQRADLDREAADKRAEVDREIAEKRAKADREIALDNQREAALQNYFDAITKLIFDRNLRNSKSDDEVREIAQIKTATTLDRLDGDRKGKLLIFLYNTNLIMRDKPIVNLTNVNLNEANLRDANLKVANLERANLERANLERANLEEANLKRANLEGANLEVANLEVANLEGANLKDSNLKGSNLEGSNLEGSNLERANLKGVYIKDTKYNNHTRWSAGFYPVAAGAVFIGEGKNGS